MDWSITSCDAKGSKGYRRFQCLSFFSLKIFDLNRFNESKSSLPTHLRKAIAKQKQRESQQEFFIYWTVQGSGHCLSSKPGWNTGRGRAARIRHLNFSPLWLWVPRREECGTLDVLASCSSAGIVTEEQRGATPGGWPSNAWWLHCAEAGMRQSKGITVPPGRTTFPPF